LERQRGRREISWVEELGHRICILGDIHLNHFRSETCGTKNNHDGTPMFCVQHRPRNPRL
jgi:hypothetical protein